MQILGIDVGGTGIKGAIVETATGALVQGQGDSKYPRQSQVNYRCERTTLRTGL
jgi:sugar (pentulose or hexulose) kinase